MELLAVLAVLLLQRHTELSTEVHKLRIFQHYTDFMESQFSKQSWWSGYLGLLVFLIPALIIVLVAHWILSGWLFHILGFLFSVFILLYCVDFKSFRQMKDGDAVDNETVGQESQLFSILFWFIVLGPVGGVLYYLLIKALQQPALQEKALLIQGVLDWIPVRISGFLFALVGHFGSAFSWWWKHCDSGIKDAQKFMVGTARAALQLEDDKSISGGDLKTLFERALWAWVVLLAVLTLIIWH